MSPLKTLDEKVRSSTIPPYPSNKDVVRVSVDTNDAIDVPLTKILHKHKEA